MMPIQGGSAEYALGFYNGTTAYTATNNLPGVFRFNNIVFANLGSGTSTVTVAGAPLQPTGYNPHIRSYMSQLVTLSTPLQLDTDFTVILDSGPVTLSGAISGGFNLIRDGAGSGALTLSGANTFTGNITMHGGALTLGPGSSNASLGANGNTLFLQPHRFASAPGLINNGAAVVLEHVISVDSSLNSVATFGGTQAMSFSSSGTRGLTGGDASTLLVLNGTNQLTLTDAGIADVRGTWRIDNGTLAVSGANESGLGNAENDFILNGGSIANASNSAELNFGAQRVITLMRPGFTHTGDGGTLTTGGASGGIMIDEVNQITGPGGFKKSGAGTLTIAQPQDFGGFQTVTVNAGVLNVNSDAALGSETNRVALTANGSTFQLASGLGSLTTARRFSTSHAGAVIDTGGNDLTITGTFDAGTTGFTKTGAGVLALSQLTSAGGTITVAGGTLRLNDPVKYRRDVALNGGNLDLNGFSTRVRNLSGTGNIAFGGTGSTTLEIRQPVAYGGIISGTGTLLFSSSPSFIGTLQGKNTFTGAVQVQGGTVSLAGLDGSLASASGYVVSGGGRLIAGDENDFNNNQGPRLNPAAFVTLGGPFGGGTLEVKGSNFNFDEKIRGINLQPGASSIVVGGGFVELVVTGNASESVTRTAGSTVNVGGKLFIGMVPNLPVFVNSTYVGWTIGNYDFVSLFMDAAPVTQQSDPNQWTSPSINYDTGTTNPTANLTTSRTINGLRIGGGFDPTLTLNAGTTLSINNGMIIGAAGGASILGGTLTSNNLNDLIVVGNGDTRIGSTIANRGPTFPIGFTKAGPGTVTLGNGASDTTPNTYTGPTTVNGGTLILDKATGTNAVGGDVLMLGGTLRFARAGQIPTTSNITLSIGTINFTNNANPTFRTFTFNGGTVSNLGTMSLNGSGVVLTLGSGTTMPGGIALTNAGSATVRYNGRELGSVLNGAVNLGAVRRIFDVDDGDAATDLSVAGLLSGGSAGGSFTKTGPGRLDLVNSSNSFTGNITVDAGTLGISANGQLGAANNGVILNGGTLANSATFTLGSSRILTFGSLGGTMEQSVNTLTLSGSGQLSGSGTLTKTGTGTVAITNANPGFTGNIVLAGGTVAANSTDALGAAGSTTPTLTFAGGDLSTSVALNLARNVKVSDNATISGTGSFTSSGAFTVDKGATLSLSMEGGAAFTGTLDGSGTITYEPAIPSTVTMSAAAGSTFAGKLIVGAKTGGDATLAFTRDLPGASIVVGSLAQTSVRFARVGLAGSSGFALTSPVTFLHDPASQSGAGFLVERNGPGLNDSGQVFTVAGDVTGNGSVTIGGIGLNGVGELAFAGALTHTGSASGFIAPGPGTGRFATGPGGLFTESGAFVRFTDPSKLPSGGVRGQTSYLGAFAFSGPDFGQGYILQGSATPYSFANTPSANSPAYKFVFGGEALTVPVSVLGATDGPVTLRADVLIHSGFNSTGDTPLGLLARGDSLFTLGDASQPVRFQPSMGRDVVTRVNTNATATPLTDGSGSRTIIKIGSGTVALGNVEYTDLAGSALPAPDTRFAWQIGRGTAGNTGANSYFDGALRETGNTIATSLNNGSTSWTVQLRGGVLESNNARANYASTNNRFERSLGTGLADVNWGPGGGGFAAADGPFNIRIGGTISPLEWQAPNFVGNGEPLIFGSRTANDAVTFENPIALANGNDQVVTREFRVINNPESAGDRAVLTGEVRDRGDGTSGGAGTRALLKSGDGILELAGALNNYEGPTTVAEGTLLVSGKLTASTESVSVQAGGTLGGAGQIGRPVNVLGSLSPGDGIGVLELESSLLLGGGSILHLEIGGAAPGDGPGFHDQLKVTSATQGVSIESTATLSLTLANNYAPIDGSAFYLVTRSDSAAFGNPFAGLPEGATVNLGGIYSGQITYQANWNGTPESSTITGGSDVAIIHVVPEPGSAALVLTGAIALIGVRRSRRSSAEM